MKKVLGLVTFIVFGYVFFACKVFRVAETATLAGGGKGYEYTCTHKDLGTLTVLQTKVDNFDLISISIVDRDNPAYLSFNASGLTSTSTTTFDWTIYKTFILNFLEIQPTASDSTKSIAQAVFIETSPIQRTTDKQPAPTTREIYFKGNKYSCDGGQNISGGAGPSPQ